MSSNREGEKKKGNRPRRFERDPHAKEFPKTKEDVLILKHLHTHRFLTTSLVIALDQRSDRIVKNRLRKLYDGHYIDKPPQQLEFYKSPGDGNRDHIYALDNKGARLLVENKFIELRRFEYPKLNARAKNYYIEHTLLEAEFMVALELTVQKRDDVRIVSEDEIFAKAPSATRNLPRPFTWQRELTFEEDTFSRGVKPDKVFGLHFLDRPEGENTMYFFLEADRGTETPVGANLKRSYFGKMLVYARTHLDGFHTERFGIPNFRMLTFTTKQTRVNYLLTHVQKMKKEEAKRVLWLVDKQTFDQAEDLLELPWVNGCYESCRLGD